MTLLDLSHTLDNGTRTYPHLPGPLICDYLSREDSQQYYEAGTTFQFGKVEMLGTSGTWVDAPFHRFAEGEDVAQLALEKLAHLDGVVVHFSMAEEGRAIRPEHLEGLPLRGRAVLIHTGWSQHFGTPLYAEGHPFLTAESAQMLCEAGIALLGVDSLNVDDTDDGRRPVHTKILGAGIPISEHLTGLEKLPREGFRFHAAPVKLQGMGTFPVRAYAVVDPAGD